MDPEASMQSGSRVVTINKIELNEDDFTRLDKGEWLNCKVLTYMYVYTYTHMHAIYINGFRMLLCTFVCAYADSRGLFVDCCPRMRQGT